MDATAAERLPLRLWRWYPLKWAEDTIRKHSTGLRTPEQRDEHVHAYKDGFDLFDSGLWINPPGEEPFIDAKPLASRQERIGQCCFLVLGDKDPYAVGIPCARPQDARRLKYWLFSQAESEDELEQRSDELKRIHPNYGASSQVSDQIKQFLIAQTTRALDGLIECWSCGIRDSTRRKYCTSCGATWVFYLGEDSRGRLSTISDMSKLDDFRDLYGFYQNEEGTLPQFCYIGSSEFLPLCPDEMARESDSAILERLKRTALESRPWWTMLLPLRWTISVSETQFLFLGSSDRLNRYKVQLQPFDICNAIFFLALDADVYEGSEFPEPRLVGHGVRATSESFVRMRRARLDNYDLLTQCLADPELQSSYTIKVLDGMGLRSSVYATWSHEYKLYVPSPENPHEYGNNTFVGLHVTFRSPFTAWLRWQRPAIASGPVPSWPMIGVAILSVAVVAFAVWWRAFTGDWNVAMGAGAFAVGFVTLIVVVGPRFARGTRKAHNE